MDILILGAGYAGLRAALDLAEAQRDGRLGESRLTLLDRNDYHQVITWLHQVAAATIPADEGRVPLDHLFRKGGLTVVQGEVRGIAPHEQRVLLQSGEALSYDRLVLALGSVTVWPPIAGLREHALPMRWWQEAVAIREAVQGCFARAAQSTDEAERRRLLTVTVVGGGYTGCQLAGELAHWLPELADNFGIDLMELTLRQLEAAPTLMGGWERSLADKAERVLRRKGVQILLDSALTRVDDRTLTLEGKAPLPYGVVIWAGGIRAPAWLEQCGFESGAQGRIVVDETLRARGFPNVFVAGDCALWLRGDKPLPATASHALRQGEYVARMLRREVEGRSLAPYEPTDLGLVVSLGGSDGVGTALGLPLSGLAAGILKEGVESWYLSTIGAE